MLPVYILPVYITCIYYLMVTCIVTWLLFRFKELCEEAFLELREKGDLLISLFMMMLSTGIPELKKVSDVKYIKVLLSL